LPLLQKLNIVIDLIAYPCPALGHAGSKGCFAFAPRQQSQSMALGGKPSATTGLVLRHFTLLRPEAPHASQIR
jgi:hypothetical protein